MHTDAVTEIGDELSDLTNRRRTFMKTARVSDSESSEDQLMMKNHEVRAGLEIIHSLRDQAKRSRECTIPSRGPARRSLVPAFMIFCTTIFPGTQQD